MVLQYFANFRTNIGNLRISQDICYVWITDNAIVLIKYGPRANLLNSNNKKVFDNVV